MFYNCQLLVHMCADLFWREGERERERERESEGERGSELKTEGREREGVRKGRERV